MAVLLGSLLPVLSHAVVAHSAVGQGWVEVCTVSGMAWVRQVSDEPGTLSMNMAGTGSGQPDDTLANAMVGCDWCATHAPALGLPGLDAVAGLATTGQATVPLAFLHAPRLLQVWASAQSRAPPLLA